MSSAQSKSQSKSKSQSIPVPDVAIRWAIKYSSCDTNYNLAAISNVDRRWRSLLCQEMADYLELVGIDLVLDLDLSLDLDLDLIGSSNNNGDSSNNDGDCNGANANGNVGGKSQLRLQSKSKSKSKSISKSKSLLSEYKHLSNLLLPNMAVEILRRQIENRRKHKSDYDLPVMASQLPSASSSQPPSASQSASASAMGSFCLSWFPPEGIKIQKVNLNESFYHDYYSDDYDDDYYDDHNDDDDNSHNDYRYGNNNNNNGHGLGNSLLSSNSNNSSNLEDENCEIHFYRQRLYHQQQAQAAKARAEAKAKEAARETATSNAKTKTNSNEPRDQNNDTNINGDTNTNGNTNTNTNINFEDYDNNDDNDNNGIVLCSNEWQGYRGAMDVLLPLGYTTAFVQLILELAANIPSSINTNPNVTTNNNNTNTNNNNNKSNKLQSQFQSNDPRETTFAVRGAVFARPQHFCLCWDSDHAESKLVNHMSILGIDKDHSRYNNNSSSSSSRNSNNNNHNNKHDENRDRDDRNRNSNNYNNNNTGGREQNSRDSFSTREHTYTREHTRNSYKLMDLRRRKRRHDRMRLVKMKEALPRLILSTPRKNPFFQDPEFGLFRNTTTNGSNESNGNGNGYINGNDQSSNRYGHGNGYGQGKRQKCLQFLNADKSRAVYLRTPPFDCGSIQGPITMFCIGIATEDGCFVSGLNSRFELGHLHGIDEMDKSIDMSPVCICAEGNTDPSSLSCDNDTIGNGIGIGNSIGNSNGTSNGNGNGICETINVRSYSEDSSDSSCYNGDYQIKRKGSIFCQCQIQYRNPNTVAGGSLSEEDDEMSTSSRSRRRRREPMQKNIYRGRMGPGRWHCYTAVFDGVDSLIRVDGCTEQVRNARTAATTTNSRNDRSNTDTASTASSNGNNKPSLDGLIIGSDHLYEMTLCFGEGSEGEGEGSISELAVFKGALQIQDIECYENYLMKKHGIVHGQHQIFPQRENSVLVGNGKIGNQWQEDLWRRQAHALMTHPPNSSHNSTLGGGSYGGGGGGGRDNNGGGGIPMSIPLRVAAKHRSVAWHRLNDVTGKNVKVSRIGSRQSHGSSDW